MNTNVLIAYLGVGAIGKLITLRYPSPGQQWAAIVEIVIGGLVAGLLADALLPGTRGWLAIVFASIPFVFAAIGRWLAPVIDRARLWWVERHDETEAGETERSQTEPDDRLGAGSGETGAV